MAENNERQPPDSFVYQPLDPSKREIRLLYLDPISSLSSLISGAIVHVSLNEKFDCDNDTCYDTISYSWGVPELCRRVLVDGRILLVTRNAENALRAAQLSDEIRRIWIDSVCIDQSALEERARQVMLMGEIYRGGCQNLIHLGDWDYDEPALERAIDNIQAVYEEIRADTDDFTKFESCIPEKTDSGTYSLRSQTPLKVELDYDALKNFFSIPCFRYVAMRYGLSNALTNQSCLVVCGWSKRRSSPKKISVFAAHGTSISKSSRKWPNGSLIKSFYSPRSIRPSRFHQHR